MAVRYGALCVPMAASSRMSAPIGSTRRVQCIFNANSSTGELHRRPYDVNRIVLPVANIDSKRSETRIDFKV